MNKRDQITLLNYRKNLKLFVPVLLYCSITVDVISEYVVQKNYTVTVKQNIFHLL